MTDAIRIHRLRVAGRVGVTPEERARPQALIIDVEVAAGLRKAGLSDELRDTIDYANVAERIERVVAEGESKLLEHLAQRIVDEISPILGVESVTVEVAKEHAPMPQQHDRVSVRLERP